MDDQIARSIEGCRRSHATLLATVADLTDGDARRPSLLPDWTVGHVLTHIARNADSVTRRLEGAIRGEIVDQYPGGAAGREAEIESGAGRAGPALVEDVRRSAADMHDVCERMPAEAWSRLTRSVTGSESPAAKVVFGRWREVEVHHVDLGLGYTPAQWPRELVEACLPDVLTGLPQRADAAQLLAWALCRGPAPTIAPWG
jgi:maleylpyruvate isomerase